MFRLIYPISPPRSTFLYIKTSSVPVKDYILDKLGPGWYDGMSKERLSLQTESFMPAAFTHYRISKRTFCTWTLNTKLFKLLLPETHIKRQATRHDCLPSLLGDWNCVRWWQIFVLGRLGQSRQDKNILYWPDELNEPTKEGPPFMCTPWCPVCISFYSQQRPPLSNLSGSSYRNHREQL